MDVLYVYYIGKLYTMWMIKHLKEQNVGYFEHWWRAMKISGALLVHAFLPDVLSDYASKEICDD